MGLKDKKKVNLGHPWPPVTERLGAIPRNTLPMTNVVIDLIPQIRGVHSVHTSRYVNRKNHFVV